MIRIPIITLSISSAALIVYVWPSLADRLVFERHAILEGQWWRLLTAPFVHFSFSHFFRDTLLFGLAGRMIARSGYTRFWAVCVFASIFPGLFYLMTAPELERYGGLSGLATGAVVYLCLCRYRKIGKDRIIWITILVLIWLKIMVEIASDTPVFVHIDRIRFHNLSSAHAFGYAGAMIIWIWRHSLNRLRLQFSG
jgi:rhomboid family GlyGly-CTERM serine protease